MNIPLSLYIHVPWCIKKCPYCDFNSHALNSELPQAEYVAALLDDLQHDLDHVQNRSIKSIFIGGGTPSLFAPKYYGELIDGIAKKLSLVKDIEITMEMNPGTSEYHNIQDYRTAGINRISLGVQSFNETQLERLGRIHSSTETFKAIEKIRQANFNSFNLDIMHGLPEQTIDEAINDLQLALLQEPPHLSWYQLTIEPNTVFAKYPPKLPIDDLTWEIQINGEDLLRQYNFNHYEVSAFAQAGKQCQHNLNYWYFGDYLGIGAGAHGKITDLQNGKVTRMWKTRGPKDYLHPEKSYLAGSKVISAEDLLGEYMLNRLRAFEPVSWQEIEQYTGVNPTQVKKLLSEAISKELIILNNNGFVVTELGKKFLNDLMAMF